MRTRLLGAAVCILILPLWFSASPDDKGPSLTPFNTTAYAGHTTTGAWCECDTGVPGCICDPGEAGGGTRMKAPDQGAMPVGQGVSPIPARSGFDLGTGLLMLLLALFVCTRLRI